MLLRNTKHGTHTYTKWCINTRPLKRIKNSRLAKVHYVIKLAFKSGKSCGPENGKKLLHKGQSVVAERSRRAYTQWLFSSDAQGWGFEPQTFPSIFEFSFHDCNPDLSNLGGGRVRTTLPGGTISRIESQTSIFGIWIKVNVLGWCADMWACIHSINSAYDVRLECAACVHICMLGQVKWSFQRASHVWAWDMAG